MSKIKTIQEFIKHCFHLIEIKNLPSKMDFFNPNAEFIDCFYPTMDMQGKQLIKNRLQWNFNSIDVFGFNIVNYSKSTVGNCIPIEIEVTHLLTNGKKINFIQIFLVDLENQKMTRLQNYWPYDFHGVFKYRLTIQHWLHKIKQIRGSG